MPYIITKSTQLTHIGSREQWYTLHDRIGPVYHRKSIEELKLLVPKGFEVIVNIK
jgi:hypothetical protein